MSIVFLLIFFIDIDIGIDFLGMTSFSCDKWLRKINLAKVYYMIALHNLNNTKNTHKGVILLVKLQVEAYNCTKSNSPPWMFFTFLKLYKWYQIIQSITYVASQSITVRKYQDCP